jgi:hypothetical protein
MSPPPRITKNEPALNTRQGVSTGSLAPALLVVDYVFFVAPSTEQWETMNLRGAGYDFRLRLSAALGAKQEPVFSCQLVSLLL